MTALADDIPLKPTSPFYWSVRRELWENRSLHMAPLIAAGVLLFGFLLSMRMLPHRLQEVAGLDTAGQAAVLSRPYDIIAIAIILTSLLVGLFYCLGALHNERRDRSILFWKSLPVSDLVTVLSKAVVPMVVLPAIALVVIVATQLVMLLLSTADLLSNGLNPGLLWQRASPLEAPLVLPYGLAVLAVWNAPVYGWLLMVSAWARRATFLWAILPPLALCVVEKIAFDTANFGALLMHRLGGGFDEAFDTGARGHGVLGGAVQMEPGRFLTSPDVWGGVAIAAAFIAAAVWLRRYREPI